jgi:hypothetical protein
LGIINSGSKEIDENFALAIATQSEIKLGKSVDKILGWLRGKPCTNKKTESPDFILNSSSGVVGIEHFKVSTGSIEKRGKWYSLPDEIYGASKGEHCDHEKTEETYKKAMVATRYPSSICTFKSILEKHLKHTKEYKEHISNYGGDRLVFLIELVHWDFIGLTAVGKKTFDCDYDNIPLCKDIVDSISEATDVDAVVILFNFYPYHNSTVFAFTPQEAKNGDIGEEIYEYIGYDESLEEKLIKLSCDGVLANELCDIDNYHELTNAVMENFEKSQLCIRSGKSCLVVTCVYDMMMDKGLVYNKRKN